MRLNQRGGYAFLAGSLGGDINFVISDIVFVDGDGDQTHDLRQYYQALIPAGEVVVSITSSPNSNPFQTGVATDLATEDLEFTDSTGVVSTSNPQIDVRTEPELLTTFTLVES